MLPCDACGSHVRLGDLCPVCGAARAARITAAAALLGLSACVGETKTGSHTGSTSQDYGAGITDTESPTDHTGSMSMDYGVPSTYGHTGDTGN